jgi:hypothetical protein
MVEKSSVLTLRFFVIFQSSSNWRNYGSPHSLFSLNFNSNTVLGKEPAHEDTKQDMR